MGSANTPGQPLTVGLDGSESARNTQEPCHKRHGGDSALKQPPIRPIQALGTRETPAQIQKLLPPTLQFLLDSCPSVSHKAAKEECVLLNTETRRTEGFSKELRCPFF